MEPITIVVVGLFFFVRYGVTDAIAAARGTEPARVAARRERAERAAARTGPSVPSALAARVAALLDPAPGRQRKAPGPFRRYLTALWRDSWEHAGEVHARREEQRKAGTLPRQRFARWATGQAQDWWTRRTGQPRRVGSERVDRCEYCTDPDCRGECVEPADWEDQPTHPPARPEPAAAFRGDRDWWGEAPTAQTPPPQSEATVHPIRPDTGGTTVTTSNNGQLDGETYNPEAGINFAARLAANQTNVAASCETSEASLAGHADGQVLALLGEIKDDCQAIAAKAQRLGAVFQTHQEAGEAAAAAGVTAKDYLHA